MKGGTFRVRAVTASPPMAVLNCEYEPVDKSVKWSGMEMGCTSQWGAVPKLRMEPAICVHTVITGLEKRLWARTFAAYAGGPEFRSQHPPKEPGVAMRMLCEVETRITEAC